MSRFIFKFPWTRGRVLHSDGWTDIKIVDTDALDELWWMVEKFTSCHVCSVEWTLYSMLCKPQTAVEYYLRLGHEDYANKTGTPRSLNSYPVAPETEARSRVVQELAFAAVGRPTILPERPYLPPFEDLGPAPGYPRAPVVAAAADPAPVEEIEIEIDDDNSILDPVPGVSPAEEPQVEAPAVPPVVAVPRRQRRRITRVDLTIVRAGRRLADLPRRARKQPNRLHF